jgi:ADP-ribosylglycohydrolase
MSQTFAYGKFLGAVTGRFAGCLLGVPVENYPIARMKEIAREGHDEFPPKDYWSVVDRPDQVQYGTSPRHVYSRKELHCVEVDDDITYTILNLILLEKYGFSYTLDDVAELWKKELPFACTAEDVVLRNLQKGIAPEQAKTDLNQTSLIGAAIRADAFGYVYAGSPKKAAALAFNDARLTHEGDGIDGELFLAASIAEAFASMTPLEALKKGAAVVPASSLSENLAWAFAQEGYFSDSDEARALLDARFSKMSCVGTINNMCAIVFAAMLGKDSFESCLANSIAIGLDNDCNGASLGSIAGACFGFGKIPSRYYECFHDQVRTYLRDYPLLSLQDVARRFQKLYLIHKEDNHE